jgi:hypothetical protein
MLFVMLGHPRGGFIKEAMARRFGWSAPEGVRTIAEYWLMNPDPATIIICEADSIAPIMAATSPWDDLFSFTVVPAVTAEQGMEMAKKMMG